MMRRALPVVAAIALVSAAPASLSSNLPDGYYCMDTYLPVVVQTDLDKTWFRWSSALKQVRILRSERSSASAPWGEPTKQTESTSYEISMVSGVCDGSSKLKTLYISGVHDNGDSVLEKWHFNYSGGLGGGLPSVSRSVLYQGASLGKIVSIAPDPTERFVLFITHSPKKIYKLSLPVLSAPQVIFDTTSVPSLVDSKFILFKNHASEGPTYVVFNYLPWDRKALFSSGTGAQMILLKDPEDDGVFVVAGPLTFQQWKAAGYDDAGSWDPSSVCVD